MNILLGNNTLSILAGSETWTKTLGEELVRQGHRVTAFSPILGYIATQMEGGGIKCVSDIGDENSTTKFSPIFEESNASFDVIICNHYEITKYLHNKFPNVPIIATVHGILHGNKETGEIWPEHPVTEFKVDQYIAVSEEVQNLIKNEYGIESKIIRNFFDLDKFKKDGKISQSPKLFLVNSNYFGVDDQITKVIKAVSNHYGGQLIGVGANFEVTAEINEVLKDVDVVFGVGRSVLEGVCMGKIGVVHGRWGTGGVINPTNVKTLREVNFSGRGSAGIASPEQIIAEIDASFNQKTVNAMHTYMKREHNVVLAAKEYIKIAEGLINDRKSI